MVHTTCAVRDCMSSSYVNKDLKFHQFPHDEERCKIWIEACGRVDLLARTSDSLKYTYICSLHFLEHMYGKKSLKKTAIPVLLLPKKESRSIHTQTYYNIEEIFQVSKKLKLSDDKCKDVTEKQILTGCDKLSPQLGAIVKNSESSGAEQPSCSSFADTDMEEEHPEEKSDPSPTTWMEIKQEVLWDGEQSAQEPVAAQAEQPAREAAPPREEERGERQILEELRRNMDTLARRDEVSSGLEGIRQQIRNLAQGDEFDAFGRYVASLLRNMRPRRASHAQPLLINLLAAEMMKQNDDDLA